MKIISADYVISVAGVSQLPKDNLPQIAFAGRSNVGKSSLLNALLNRKKLALTSANPGKTRLLNFFIVNQQFYFVDLPGYGFARQSQDERERWKTLVEDYLEKGKNLRAVVVLIDIRLHLTDLDEQLLIFLNARQIPCLVVMTKADKLSNNQRAVQVKRNAQILHGLGIKEFVVFSAVKGMGKVELWAKIADFIKQA